MRHPVLIHNVPAGTALHADLTDWLADNHVPTDARGLIYDGTFLVEWLDPDSLQQRHWNIRTSMPRGMLAQLALTEALGCTAVHPGTSEHPVRCARPVDSAGRHPGGHLVLTPEALDPQGWTNRDLPPRPELDRLRRARNRAVIHLAEDRLADLLRLPDGQRVIGFDPQQLTLGINVHLEGDGLPETPPMCEPFRIGLNRSADLIDATDPAGIHTGVLAALADITHLEGHRSYEARLRQLERHAPTEGILRETGDYSDARCSRCIEEDMSVPWPCDDYRDSAASVTVLAWLPKTSDDTQLAGQG